MHLQIRSKKLEDRVEDFSLFMADLSHTYKRCVLTAADREVSIWDTVAKRRRQMLMFASNNYLGLATHPHVVCRVNMALDKFGCGVGGPPLLNGYSMLMEETEDRIAAFKHHESALLFSSGFMTNLGLLGALAEPIDTIIYDELSHASFYDGIKLTKAKAISFRHNDICQLTNLIERYKGLNEGTVFVCVEGVYSMDGDMAPLREISAACKCNGCVLIIDDAHGTGVLGEGGRGTAFHLGCEGDIDISMGTFSKVFATCGGFVTASKALVEYIRYYARPYMFSASLPPPVLATVLGGLEVLENEPWLRAQLLSNVDYAIARLRQFGFYAIPKAAIITLSLPKAMDIRRAAWMLHEKGMFVNSVEYPAVPVKRQRFRISLMATHTKEDIDRLVTALEEVWNDPFVYAL